MNAITPSQSTIPVVVPESPQYDSGEDISDSDSDNESQSVRSDDSSEPDWETMCKMLMAKDEARKAKEAAALKKRRERDAERRAEYRESAEGVAKQREAAAKKAEQKYKSGVNKANKLIARMGPHVVAALESIRQYQEHCIAARVSAGDDYKPYITTLNNLMTVMDAKATADLTAVVKAAQKASKAKRAAAGKK